MMPPDIMLEVKGIANPVRCVRIFLELVGAEINEKSFAELERITPDACAFDGFWVESIEDANRVCLLGGFSVRIDPDTGKLMAVKGN